MVVGLVKLIDALTGGFVLLTMASPTSSAVIGRNSQIYFWPGDRTKAERKEREKAIGLKLARLGDARLGDAG